MKFTDTINKQTIRNFDKRILEQFSTQKQKKLSYFGLPGENMLDVLEWRNYLYKYLAIEYNGLSYSGLIFTALSQGLSSGFDSIKGDIDDILLENINDKVKFPFDIFNLDYSGGAIYKDKSGEAKRLKAWENLFRKQSKYKHDFLLFLTLNSREKDEGEINVILNEILTLINREKKSELAIIVKNIISEGKKRDKFKIYIPCLIARYASNNKYRILCHPPVCYTGSSNIPMMHFIFELEFKRGRASPLFPISLDQIINIPLYYCENGVIYDDEGGII